MTAQQRQKDRARNQLRKALRVQRKAFVVRKSIPIKAGMDPESETLYKVGFKQEMLVIADQPNGWLEVSYRTNRHKDEDGVTRGDTYHGYVRKAWVAPQRVHDLARLPYRNLSGKRYPTSMVYGGKASGFIEPGETVSVIAYCSPYALTSKGWSRTDLIRYEENATENCLVCVLPEDHHGFLNLLEALTDATVDDYVANERHRKAIKAWTKQDWFMAVYGDHSLDFIKRCEEALAEDLRVKEEKRKKAEEAARKKAARKAARRKAEREAEKEAARKALEKSGGKERSMEGSNAEDADKNNAEPLT